MASAKPRTRCDSPPFGFNQVLLADAKRSDEAQVRVVRSNPHPGDFITPEHTDRAVSLRDPHRVKRMDSAHPFELELWAVGLFNPDRERFAGALLHFGRKSGEMRPKLPIGPRPHLPRRSKSSGVVFPSSISFIASSAQRLSCSCVAAKLAIHRASSSTISSCSSRQAANAFCAFGDSFAALLNARSRLGWGRGVAFRRAVALSGAAFFAGAMIINLLHARLPFDAQAH